MKLTLLPLFRKGIRALLKAMPDIEAVGEVTTGQATRGGRPPGPRRGRGLRKAF
jgi:hypothetical protein